MKERCEGRFEQLEETASLSNGREGQTLVQQTDVTVSEDVKKLFERVFSVFGRLDLLFNNNQAILYEDIIYKNLETVLLADRLEIDLITKNSKISMNDTNKKIQIVGKN